MNTIRTFAGIPEECGKSSTASIVLIPVPYDGTSTWGKGADKGPDALLEAAENMELYDIETGTEVYTHGIYLAPGEQTPENVMAQLDAINERSGEQELTAGFKQTFKFVGKAAEALGAKS